MKEISCKPIISWIQDISSPPPIQRKIQYENIEYILIPFKACKQSNQSVYVLFLYLWIFFEVFSICNATNHPFTSGLRVKGDKRAKLTSFQKRKEVKNHETIFFSSHD